MRILASARFVLLVVAASCLVLGLGGGLERLGMMSGPPLAGLHGAFMVCGFFGTLISLERAVAHGTAVALLVPAFSAAGALLLCVGQEDAGALAFLLAGVGLTGLTLDAAIRLPTMFTAAMTMGASFWAWGTWNWLQGTSIAEVSYVWLGFLVLTVAAERLELSRIAGSGAAARMSLTAILILFTASLVAGQPWRGGSWLLGGALAAMAGWFLCHDIALWAVRRQGFARFSAVCLLAGYAWLVVAGCFLISHPPADAPFGHDAAVHAIGTGFILSMVFAHAPIILPAVTGAPVRYNAFLYGPVVVLQSAVMLRVLADASERASWQQGAAALTVVSVILYAILLLGTALVRTASRPSRAWPTFIR